MYGGGSPWAPGGCFWYIPHIVHIKVGDAGESRDVKVLAQCGFQGCLASVSLLVQLLDESWGWGHKRLAPGLRQISTIHLGCNFHVQC